MTKGAYMLFDILNKTRETRNRHTEDIPQYEPQELHVLLEEDLISQWEHDFLSSIIRRGYRYRHQLTEKQREGLVITISSLHRKWFSMSEEKRWELNGYWGCSAAWR